MTDSNTTALAPVAQDVTQDLHLVARTQDEMRTAQQSLSQWFDAKAAILEKDAAELEQSRDIAKQNKWGTAATLTKHASLARKRVEFYRKCKAAVDAGFCIVPNFDVELFAVRTAKAWPRRNHGTAREAQQIQLSEGPPAGEGTLVDPQPAIERAGTRPATNWEGKPIKNNDGSEQREQLWSAEQFAEVDFPISVARPEIMSATAEAMALKVFDEFGVQTGRVRQERVGPVKGDPIVVARIVDPRSTTYSRRFVTFLVAWYVNTKDL